jgi:hypothetical protein
VACDTGGRPAAARLALTCSKLGAVSKVTPPMLLSEPGVRSISWVVA